MSCVTDSRIDRRPSARVVAGLLVALLHASPARGQDALVLSGGGSRGLAHAGAILGLEQKGFRPDLVLGASMGAVIGGLYATGVSPDSIWSLARGQEWNELFSMRRTSVGPVWDGRRPMFELGLAVDRSRYADGLISDWRVNRLLARMFFDAGARARGDFDALPRRFRAVAADLRTGELVVLGSGDLALAVRASMAVPGVFAPVLWNGAPLSDGGLADYLPVGPARDAGAQRVVAVDVLRPPADEIGLNPFQVMLRSVRYTLYNARRETDPPDVWVQPRISPDLFAAVFPNEPASLLEAGLRAGREVSLDLTGGAGARPAREPPSVLGDLSIESNDPSLEGLVRTAFAGTTGGRYDAASVLEVVDRLYATALFQGIWPRVEAGSSGDSVAHLIVRADAVPPLSVAAAAGYDTDRGFRGWASISQRFAGPARVVVAASAGAIESWASLSIRRPLAQAVPAFGLDAGASLGAFHVRRFDGKEVSAEHEVRRAGGWVGAGWRGIDPHIEVRAAVQAEHVDDGALEGLAVGPVLRVGADRRHGRVVGEPALLDVDVRFGSVPYRRYRAAGSLALEHGAISAAVVGGLAIASDGSPEDALPALGDGNAMPGLRWGRDRGHARVIGGLDVAVAVPSEAHARVRLRAGASAAGLDALDDTRWLGGIEAGILWWTPFGRIAIDAGVSTRGDWRIGLDLGPAF